MKLNPKQDDNVKGFTIIEVLIVLAIAGLIMLIVFLAVPSLMRRQRNYARSREASMLMAAVTECMSYRKSPKGCDSAAELPLQASDFSVFEGFHFGAADNTWPVYGDQKPPSATEPNWLFGLTCNEDGSELRNDDPFKKWVITYLIEKPGATSEIYEGGWLPRCINN